MQHPVVIIGAGPIGLAAAANAAERGMDFVVLEAGPTRAPPWVSGRTYGCSRPGPSSSTPPRVDSWTRPARGPPPTTAPTRPAASGARAYLQPLADAPGRLRRRSVRYGARVVGVGRAGRDLHGRLRPRDRPVRRACRRPRGPRAAAGQRGRRRLRHLDQPEPAGRRRLPRAGRDGATPHRITYGIPDLTRPGGRGPVRGQARRRRRQGRLGAGRPDRPRQAGRGPTPAPGCPGCCAARAWATRSAAATTTSSSNAASSARTPRQPPPAGLVTNVTQFRTESVHAQPDGRLTHRLGRRPAGHRRRRGHRRHRLPPRLRVPLRGTPRPRPGPRRRTHPGRPDPPRPPLLRRRRPARLPRAAAAGAGPLPGRHEVLRPRAVLPGHDRLRAGPIRRRRPRR